MPNKKAVFETSKGAIEAELFAEEVPNTVANFEKLANSAFYDGTKFHRVIANFMIQGGDPYSKSGKGPVGTGGPGYTIKCETHRNTHKHVAGTLSMAHAGKDTGGSQFFICHSPQKHLDGVHTVFGQVTKGMDVVNAIAQNDEIRSLGVSEIEAGAILVFDVPFPHPGPYRFVITIDGETQASVPVTVSQVPQAPQAPGGGGQALH